MGSREVGAQGELVDVEVRPVMDDEDAALVEAVAAGAGAAISSEYERSGSKRNWYALDEPKSGESWMRGYQTWQTTSASARCC